MRFELFPARVTYYAHSLFEFGKRREIRNRRGSIIFLLHPAEAGSSSSSSSVNDPPRLSDFFFVVLPSVGGGRCYQNEMMGCGINHRLSDINSRTLQRKQMALAVGSGRANKFRKKRRELIGRSFKSVVMFLSFASVSGSKFETNERLFVRPRVARRHRCQALESR